jgi:hypothetical protein
MEMGVMDAKNISRKELEGSIVVEPGSNDVVINSQ